MAQIKLKGNPINTNGTLPQKGEKIKNFLLTNTELQDKSLDDFKQKKLLLNIFPSLDTPVCAASVRKFNEKAAQMENTKVLCISKDLPFAHKRFCTTEGIENVTSLSQLRDNKFGKDNGLEIIDGPMKGLLARAVIILNENHEVIYTELVDDIVNEPNYEKALKLL